jgi:hypothetical protein
MAHALKELVYVEDEKTDGIYLIDTFRKDISRIIKLNKSFDNNIDDVMDVFESKLKYPDGFIKLIIELTDLCLELFNILIIKVIKEFNSGVLSYDELLTFDTIYIPELGVKRTHMKSIISHFIKLIILNMPDKVPKKEEIDLASSSESEIESEISKLKKKDVL